jgi:hypothetical protein
LIYYDEEAPGWKFDKITEKEKEILTDLGQRHFADDMAFSIVKRQLEQDEDESEGEFMSMEEYLDMVNKEDIGSA